MQKLLLLLIVLLFISSCNKEREQALEKREEALMNREEQFAKKEAEYRSLLEMRDSILSANKTREEVPPPIKKWPDEMHVNWNSKMICRESNCSNYVIGDQRNEVWQFRSDSTGLYTHVLNNDKLVRILRAQYHENKIILNYSTDSITKNKLSIGVDLDDIKKDVIKGTQTILGQDNCAAKFSVELTPSLKK